MPTEEEERFAATSKMEVDDDEGNVGDDADADKGGEGNLDGDVIDGEGDEEGEGDNANGDASSEAVGLEAESAAASAREKMNQMMTPAGLELMPDKSRYLQASQEELSRRQKSNAKAVEWLDLDGNLLGVFRSGLECNKTLGITQGDISLCCRGLKESFGGFKFRFQNEELRPEARAKKGVVYEPIIEGIVPETRVEGGTRNTRASRGEFGADRDRVEKTVDTKAKPSILAPPHLKARKWRKVLVKLGNLIIPKYISDQEVCAELQERQQPKKEVGLKRKKRSSKGGVTIGTHEILGEIDEF